MTETSVQSALTTLPPTVAEFVLQWGDMGGQWGVSRSVAQIHALLFLSERPLTAEAIANSLGIARSNVSNSLKELVGWKLLRRVPVAGDRRDYFEAETDLWQMATRIAQGRKEREIDPAVAALQRVMSVSAQDKAISRTVRDRLATMHDFVGTMDSWYGQMLTVPPPTLMALIKMGTRIVAAVKFVTGQGRSADST